MSQNRFKRIVLYATAELAFCFACGTLFAVEQRRTQAETVRSAALSRKDCCTTWTNGVHRRTVEIVIQRNPDCRCARGAEVSSIDNFGWTSLKSRVSCSRTLFAQIIPNNASQLLPEQCLFDRHQYRLASTKAGSGGFVNPSDLATKTTTLKRDPEQLGVFWLSRHVGLNLNKTGGTTVH